MRLLKFTFLATFLVISIIGCKGEKKDSELTPKEEVKVEKKLVKEPAAKDLKTFLNRAEHTFNVGVNSVLGENIEIESFSFFKDIDSVSFFIFKLKDKTADIDIKKYRMNLRVTPYKNQLQFLREDSKKLKLKTDIWNANLSIKESKHGKFIVFPLKTKITDFKTIELYLYSNELKKFIGSKIRVDYLFEKYLESRNRKNEIEINKSLGAEFSVSNMLIYKKEGDEGIYFAYQLDEEIEKEQIKGKRLVLRLFPIEGLENFLRDDTLEKGLNFDSWYIDTDLKETANGQFLFAYIPTEIVDYKTVETYIYDMNQKRFVGLPIKLNNVSVEY